MDMICFNIYDQQTLIVIDQAYDVLVVSGGDVEQSSISSCLVAAIHIVAGLCMLGTSIICQKQQVIIADQYELIIKCSNWHISAFSKHDSQ